MYAQNLWALKKQLKYEVCMTAENEEGKQSTYMNFWSLQHFVGKKKSRRLFCVYHKNKIFFYFLTNRKAHTKKSFFWDS